MNNNNYYLQSDMKYLDTVVALEDFYYGTKVKVSIASLTPLSNKNTDMEHTRKINKRNIMNKDIESLGISECTSSNYIYLFIPKEVTSYDQLHDHIHLEDIHKHIEKTQHDIHGNHILGTEYEHKYKPKGHKGDKFIIAYIGGDINKPYVIGREEN